MFSLQMSQTFCFFLLGLVSLLTRVQQTRGFQLSGGQTPACARQNINERIISPSPSWIRRPVITSMRAQLKKTSSELRERKEGGDVECKYKGLDTSKDIEIITLENTKRGILANANVAMALTIVSSLVLAPVAAHAGESEAAIAGFVRPILDNFVNIMSLLFICRTVLSWYPKTDLTKFPYSVAVWPTEPLLVPVRELIPPAFGVDISAIVWVGVLSFMREVLTGTQGILALVEKGM